MKNKRIIIMLSLTVVFFLMLFVWSISIDPPEFIHFLGVTLLAYTVGLGVMYWRFLKDK